MSTVLAVAGRIVVEYCEGAGVDTDALLGAAGVARAAVADPDGRLPIQACNALWVAAFRATRDPDLSIRVARSMRAGAYPLLYFMTANSPTVGAAFDKVCRYARWADPSLQLAVIEDAEGIGVLLVTSPDAPCGGLYQAEFVLASVYLGLLRATALAFAPREVELAAPCPGDVRAREELFGCPVRFRRARNVLWFDRHTWDQPVRAANAALLGVLDAHARSLVESTPPEPAIVQAVRGVIRDQMDQGAPSMQVVARRLGSSPRVLQRALAEAGTTYSQVVDRARIAEAKVLLADEARSLSEVALLLGFSEQSAFTRAYKRWTGVPPRTVRGSRRRA